MALLTEVTHGFGSETMRLPHILLLVLLCAPPLHAAEPTAPVSRYVPAADTAGQGRLRVLFWDIYDATLYAPEGRFDPDQPYALALKYLRPVPGRKLVDSTLDEMAKQGAMTAAQRAAWRDALNNVMPDVEAGDTLTGVRKEDGATVFYAGATVTGLVDDPAFTAAFFNIWLGENASKPDLRRALLGTGS